MLFIILMILHLSDNLKPAKVSKYPESFDIWAIPYFSLWGYHGLSERVVAVTKKQVAREMMYTVRHVCS